MKTKKKLRKSRNIKKATKNNHAKNTLYKRSYYFTTKTNLTSLFQDQDAFTVYTCIFIIIIETFVTISNQIHRLYHNHLRVTLDSLMSGLTLVHRRIAAIRGKEGSRICRSCRSYSW